LEPFIDEMKQFCMQNFGGLCHITIARDERTSGIEILSEHSFEEYKKIWGVFDSVMFDFKSKIFYQKRNEFCYAGDWSAFINLETGSLRQCYCGKELGNIYDISKPLEFEAIGYDCIMPHCYNGHAFLAIGDIPELDTPPFSEMRNRICSDGTEWLSHEMKEFMSHKLIENNEEYSVLKKKRIKVRFKTVKAYRKIRRTMGKIKRKIKKA
jgi:hypothetical protein